MQIKMLPENATDEQRDEAIRQIQRGLVDDNLAIEALTIEPPPPPPPSVD
jgi:hypothetical protein